jgi:hypothetical protein
MLCDFMDILTCKHPPLNLENFNLDSKTYIAYFSGWMGYLQCLGLTKFCLGFLLLLVGYISYFKFFSHNTWFQQQKNSILWTQILSISLSTNTPNYELTGIFIFIFLALPTCYIHKSIYLHCKFVNCFAIPKLLGSFHVVANYNP